MGEVVRAGRWWSRAPLRRALGAAGRDLGLATTEHPSGAGPRIEADQLGATAVPGVYVAGNVTDIMAWVASAASAGVMAAAAINHDLLAEESRTAIGRLAEAA